jgi:hypothetical protein
MMLRTTTLLSLMAQHVYSHFYVVRHSCLYSYTRDMNIIYDKYPYIYQLSLGTLAQRVKMTIDMLRHKRYKGTGNMVQQGTSE